MARFTKLECNKSYATEANAIKAVEAKFPSDVAEYARLTYIIQRTDDGRFFPVFIGERALQALVHFHFNVVM